MGLLERKARQKKFLRQEILDAASELFVNEGFERVSMRRIADKIEYSPTTIYLYFKDKGELLDELCQETFSRLALRLKEITAQPGTPVERLRRGLLAYIDFGLKNPHHYRATFLMPIPKELAMVKTKDDNSPGAQSFDFLRRAVADCVAEGTFRQLNIELVSQTFWAGIHGVTALLITHENGFPFADRENLAHSMVDILLAGVLSERH